MKESVTKPGRSPAANRVPKIRRDTARIPSTSRFAAGTILISLCLVSSLLLVLEHLHGLHLPGCGPAGGCAEAMSSAWARVPLLDWPVCHLGLAFFGALLVVYVVARGKLPPTLRWVVRFGGFASLGFGLVLVVEGFFCPYCAAVHLFNILFVILTERTARVAGTRTAISARPLLCFALVAASVTAVLALVQYQQTGEAAREAETALARSTAEILDDAWQKEKKSSTVLPYASRDGAGEPAGGSAAPYAPFTGRYVIGREAAPIRIVVISSYQCSDCKRIDEEIETLLAGRDDISFSHKHFPFCRDCNRFARRQNVNSQPNGCWAARAAEAAGLLGGNDGFRMMHRWLYDHGGAFTADELKRGLSELGFDVGRFIREMQGNETLRLVEADIDEAMTLGLSATPMIFINGVELKGWNARLAVTRAVTALAATNPPTLTAAADHPPAALDKYIDDWRGQPVRSIPTDTDHRFLGARDAPVRIVLWGDYQEPLTAELDRRIRRAISAAGESHLRYAFRHFPLDRACNPAVPSTRHPLACRAARAAAAAALVAGDTAYWQLHEWLFTHQKQFNDQRLEAAVRDLGLDVEAFLAAMEHPEAAEIIEEDVRAAKRLGLKSIPFLFIGGKWVPRWNLEGQAVPEAIIEEALGEKVGK